MARRATRGRCRLRYAIEQLEPRTLLSAVSWINANSGDWDTPANWSSDAIPTAADDVTINVAGVTVTHSTGSDAANSVTSSDPILLTGGTLSIMLNLSLTNTFTLSGGLLDSATVVGTPNELVASSTGGILSNVTLNVDMLIPDGGSVTVENDIALNGGNINLAGATTTTQLNFLNTGAESIEGNGSIILGGTASQFDAVSVDDTNGGISISSSNGISGTGGTITSMGTGGTFEMDGTLSANAAGPGITLSGPNWDNEGIFEAVNGGTLSINTTPTGAGTFVENNATLNLGGLIMSTNVVQRTGGVINLTGTLQSDGGAETFDTASGSWNLTGGTVSNCSLVFTGGNSLVPAGTGGTLSNVILDNDLDVPAGVTLDVANGLTLAGATITVESTATLDFTNGNSQSLGGTGQIVLNGGTLSSDDTFTGGLTIGSSIAVSGQGIMKVAANDLLQGTISANVNGQTLQLLGQTTQNLGTVQAVNGSILDIGVDLSPQGAISETNSTINFTGFLSFLPSVSQTGGMVNIAGTLDLGGMPLTFVATTGIWYFSGTIADTTLTFDAADFFIPQGLSATLQNVTLNSDLTISNGGDLFIREGLTINSAMLTIASSGSPTTLVFANDSPQTVGGNGQIIFGGTAPTSNAIFVDDSMGSLTVLPGILISGTSGTIQTNGTGGNLILQGAVDANNAGGTIVLEGPNILYQGTMEAIDGTLDINGDFQASHTGSVDILIDNGVAGQFNITGNAALDGTLNIIVANGFVPPSGSMFNIITYGGLTGGFAAVNGLTANGFTFSQNIGPQTYQLISSGGGIVQPGADLYIMSLGDSGGIYHPTDQLNGSGILVNTGAVTEMGFSVQILLSQDAIYGNADDIVLQTVPFDSIGPGGNIGFPIQANIPAATLPGTYRLIAAIVSSATMASDRETNFTNNVFIQQQADIVVNAIPTGPVDLVPTNIMYTPGIYHPGDSFTGSGTATNTGTGGTGPYNIELALSQSGVFGDRDNIVLQTITDSGFEDGSGSNSGSITATIPAGIPFGNYHVLLALDSDNVIAETNETNNVFVSPLADVVIPAPAVPPAPQPVKIGSPDPNFGVGGLAAHNVGITTTSDVAVQSDGKSVIVGTTGTPGAGDFALTRYTTNGGLDTTFGNQGTVTTDLGGDDQAASVYILPDGRILVVGTSVRTVNGQPAGSEFALARYNADGSLDTSFGGGTGMVLTAFSADPSSNPSTDVAHTVIVRGDGTFFVAGSSDAAGLGTDFAIAAYNADGSLLTSFGTGGKVLIDFNGGNDSANAIAIQKNGELILAGSTQDPTSGVTSIALARLKTNGTLDKSFNKTGRATKNLRGQDDEAASVAIQTNGQIMVGGFSATGSAGDGSLSTDFALVRFTSAGKVSSSFGHGSVITNFGQPSAITKILIQPDGKIVASGKTTGSIASLVANQLDVALARYNIDGTLDKTFSATGTAIITLAGGQTGQSGQAVHRDIASVGSSNTLMQQFTALKQSAQGALAMNQGGELLDVGTSGTDTVEAAVVTAGVDLAARVTSTLHSPVTAGKKGTASVSITNTGPDSASGAVTVSLYLSSDTSAGSGATLIQTLHPSIRLKVKQSAAFKFSFTVSSGTATGSYFLVGQINPGSLPETNVANNTAASGSLHIVAPAAKAHASRFGARASTALIVPAAVPFTLEDIAQFSATKGQGRHPEVLRRILPTRSGT